MKIKEIQTHDRPQERLYKKGAESLSDAELLAILLRQGTRNKNAIELAQEILKNYSLTKLPKAQELIKIKGIGKAKAAKIESCTELSKRINSYTEKQQPKITQAQDIVNLLKSHLQHKTQEHTIGIYLNTQQRIITQKTISIGTLNASLIHPRDIFKPAITNAAAGIILIHNHPSGDATPSKEDIEITKQLIQAANLLDIDFLDHIIIAKKNYTSLKEQDYF